MYSRLLGTREYVSRRCERMQRAGVGKTSGWKRTKSKEREYPVHVSPKEFQKTILFDRHHLISNTAQRNLDSIIDMPHLSVA